MSYISDYKFAWLELFVGTGGGGGGGGGGPVCSYSTSMGGAHLLGSPSGAGTITLTTSAGCNWTASSSASWLALGDNAGSGPTTITFGYGANPYRQSRTATITVGGQTISVTQAAAPEYLADFNGDGRGDIVWQNRMNGQILSWRMVGLNLVGSGPLGPGAVNDTSWKIVGTPDLNRDGQSDLLWQHDAGLVAVWFMRGESQISGQLITQSPLADTQWRIVATGDLDRDGSTDLIWQHANGAVAVWYMNGATVRAGELITQLSDVHWRVVGAADFNGDGRIDLVWRHRTNGQVGVWLMNNRTLIDGVLVNVSVPDPNWEIVGIGDFDNNTRPDLLWRNRSTGALAAWVMSGAVMTSGVPLNPATQTDFDWVIAGPK
jgi:hypothetical protein